MSRRIALSAVFGVLAVLLSCTNQPGDLNENGSDGIKSSYDGDWAWFENGRLTYRLTIENGQITSLTAAPNAKSIHYRTANCAIGSREGLVAFAFHDTFREGGVEWVESHTFRFDLGEEASGSAGTEIAGCLSGRRIVSRTDVEDIFLLPDSVDVAGQLCREFSK